MAVTSTRAVDPWQWQPPRPSRWEQPVGLIRLDGPDSLRFLHGQSSQDLEQARAGRCLSTCCLTSTARLRGLAEVLVDDGGAWLVITAGETAAIHQALDRVLFPADRVSLGPVRLGRLVTLLGVDLPEVRQAWAELPAGEWRRSGEATGSHDGWLLAGPARLLLDQDRPLPAWLEAIPALGPIDGERWRLQRGIPTAPAEISDEVNPFELGLAERVSLSKGCYVGQETLAKLATYDGVKQQLRRWAWTGPAAQLSTAGAGSVAEPRLEPGTALVTAAGERAGRITSALALPVAEGEPPLWLGLALVRRQALGEAELRAGDPAGAALSLRLSVPEEVVPPPVGSGGRAS